MMNGQNVKLIKLCEKYYLLSQAGMMKFPPKMFEEIKQKYLDFFNKAKAAFENNQLTEFKIKEQIKIDLSGLPENYHASELTKLANDFFGNHINILYTATPAYYASSSGFSPHPENPNYPLKIKITVDAEDIKHPDSIDNTIKHELVHFIQLLIAKYIKSKGGTTDEFFIGYPSKNALEEYYNILNSEKTQSILNRKRKKHKSEINKKDLKRDLYHLDPSEFYPYLIGAKNRLLNKVKSPTKGDFKRFVGLTKYKPDFFFEKLESYNKNAWSKAVKEFWKEIEPLIN